MGLPLKTIALGLAGLALFAIPIRIERRDMSKPEPEPEETPLPDDRQTPIDGLAPFRDRVIRIAASQLGEANRTEYGANAVGLEPAIAEASGIGKLSWCGLFATWVYQRAGAAINWTLGTGIASQLQRTNEPKPGDLAYIDQPYQHHAIVESVGPFTVTTIDGNSTGGKVARNTRNRAMFSAFYDVDSIDPDRGMA